MQRLDLPSDPGHSLKRKRGQEELPVAVLLVRERQAFDERGANIFSFESALMRLNHNTARALRFFVCDQQNLCYNHSVFINLDSSPVLGGWI